MLDLTIAAMDCWAPNAPDAQSWLRWYNQEQVPDGSEPPELPDIKPMQRRRLSLQARAAFKVAGACLAAAASRDNLICLFASAYGQCTATVAMLENIASNTAVSPAAFSLSVHNAIAGQFSIAHQLQGPSNSLAPGRDGLGGVLLEAQGWLTTTPAMQVLLCCMEEPIPASLKPYQDQPPTPMAAAYLLTAPGSAQAQRVSIERQAVEQRGDFGSPFWRQVLAFTSFLQTNQGHLILETGAADYKCTI